MVNDLRTLLSMLPPIPEEPVYISDEVVDRVLNACDRFDAEWKRLFGECQRNPLSADEE